MSAQLLHKIMVPLYRKIESVAGKLLKCGMCKHTRAGAEFNNGMSGAEICEVGNEFRQFVSRSGDCPRDVRFSKEVQYAPLYGGMSRG